MWHEQKNINGHGIHVHPLWVLQGGNEASKILLLLLLLLRLRYFNNQYFSKNNIAKLIYNVVLEGKFGK